VKRLLAGGAAVLVPDVFLTGESGALAGRIHVKNEEQYILVINAAEAAARGHNPALREKGEAGEWSRMRK